MPRFSIITVVRNDRDGLQRTGASVEAQTDRDFEWRIVDGGSTDGTADLARRLQARIPNIFVTTGPDAGLYDAMNKGLRAARGDYILFLNAGDVFADAEVLARISTALERRNCDILFGSSLMSFGAKQLRRHAKTPSYITHGQPGLHQSTVYRTDFHKRFEYSLSLRICADYECLCRMAAAGADMVSCDFLISVNEITPDSASTRNKLRMIRECFAIQRDVLGLPLRSRIASAARRAFNSMVAKGMALALNGSRR